MTASPKYRVESTLARLIEAGVSGRIFPGATAAVAWRDDDGLQVALGSGGYLDYSKRVGVGHRTLYDLADLTTVLVATTALRLASENELELDAAIGDTLAPSRGGDVMVESLRNILRHRGGLEEWGGLYLDVPHDPGTPAARRWIIGEAARRPNRRGAGPEHYSDLGYLLAGEVIAKAMGRTLDRIIRSEITETLEISSDLFFPASLAGSRRSRLARRMAPSERCEWRGRIVAGEVHDENCAALGGVAGHAGLFATASALARFGSAMLDAKAEINEFLPRDILNQALIPNADGIRGLGWCTRPEDGSVGRHMSPSAFGFDGRSGCSLWCDPRLGVTMVLLSNRSHPSRANERIDGFRPAFFDGILSRFASERPAA